MDSDPLEFSVMEDQIGKLFGMSIKDGLVSNGVAGFHLRLCICAERSWSDNDCGTMSAVDKRLPDIGSGV